MEYERSKKILGENSLKIEIEQVIHKFLNFLLHFKNIDNFSIYNPKFLKKVIKGKNKILVINIFHVAEFDPYLYLKILQFPSEILSIFDFALFSIIFKKEFEKKNFLKKKIQVSFSFFKENFKGQELAFDPKNLNKLVTVRGFVSKLTEKMVVLTSCFFRCEFCSFETYSFIEKGRLEEPVYCYVCKNFHSFKTIHERSHFTDKQFIQLQEIEDANNKRPFNLGVTLVVYDQNTDRVSIGDIIEAIGILRISSNATVNSDYPIPCFDFYLDTLDISMRRLPIKIRKRSNKIYKRLKCKENKNEISIKIESLNQNTKIFKLLKDSFCPDSFGLSNIKKGIFCQLFDNPARNSSFIHELYDKPMHLLMIGKRNIEKTDLLRFLFKIVGEKIGLVHRNEVGGRNGIYPKNNIKNLRIAGGILSIENIEDLGKEVVCVINDILEEKGLYLSEERFKSLTKQKISILCSLDLPETSRVNSENFDSRQNFSKKNWSEFSFIYYIKNKMKPSLIKKYTEKELSRSTSKILGRKEKKKFNGLGFRQKSLNFFLEFFKKDIRSYTLTLFNSKEFEKWKIFLLYLKNMKFNPFYSDENKIPDFLLKISKNLSRIRSSSIIGNLELRQALITFFEAFNSFNDLIYSGENF